MRGNNLSIPRTNVLRAILAVVIVAGVASVDAGALSAATPYRARHIQLANLEPAGLPWTNEPRLELPARRPRDKHGAPMIRVGGRHYYRPEALAINGMKQIDAFLELGDPRQLDQALLQARQLPWMALRRREAWWLPFWYDYLPAGQLAPWVNATSQGLALSFFVRLYRVTRDDIHHRAARQVFRSFLRLARPGRIWVSFVEGGRKDILKYHMTHIWQLRLPGRISGNTYFWRLAERLAGDIRPTGYAPGRPAVRKRPPWPTWQLAGRVQEYQVDTASESVTVPVTSISTTATVRTLVAASNVTAVRPDFDGDGYADLAIGAPSADVEHKNTGAVHVLYGSSSGLQRAGRQIWSQASEGIADKPERGDQFGWSVADGDFDGDGYSDLAIASRWEDAGAPDAGAVHVLYGTPDGLSAVRAQLWHQGIRGVPGVPRRLDEFGWVLAAADFDGDGRDDLVVGSHRQNVGAKDAGAVHVLYGTSDGLSAKRAQLWHQNSKGIPDRAETNDGFGKAVAAGDFDGDGHADLAIGVPYESRDVDRMGVVHVLRGSDRGLTSRGNQVWHQDTPGILERAELRDQFGQSLAAGDIDGDGRDDLVVGVWFEDYLNALSNEGGFHVLYGSRKGLRARDNQFWHQDRPGVADRTHISDRFGQALATADFDGDGFDDVAVGSPSTDLRPDVHQNRGAVHVFFGSRRGLSARRDRYLTQDSPGILDRSEPWDHFGETVAGADFDADGADDLVVGLPWEDLHARNDGAVYVIYGSPRGLDASRDQLWGAGGGPGGEGGQRDTRFGWSLTGGHPDDGAPRTGRPRL